MVDYETTELELEISAQEATAEDIDQMTRQLLKELRETDVESVELMKAGIAPPGTKSADPVTTGAIIMTVLPAALPKIIEMVQAWATRGKGRAVKFKGKVNGQVIEFEGSTEDLQKILASLSEVKKPRL
jgi:hypothetical protein